MAVALIHVPLSYKCGEIIMVFFKFARLFTMVLTNTVKPWLKQLHPSLKKSTNPPYSSLIKL